MDTLRETLSAALAPLSGHLQDAGESARSSLRVELLDRFERPIKNYSGGNAARVERSGLRVPIVWPGHDRIDDIREPFKIRVAFEGDERGAIEFFALYLEAVP